VDNFLTSSDTTYISKELYASLQTVILYSLSLTFRDVRYLSSLMEKRDMLLSG